MFQCKVQHVKQAVHVQFPGKLRILFAGG
jgi:hypothetical protein